MRVVILCHTATRSTKNPDGPDFDRIVPSLSKPAWDYTCKWADMILRGSFESTAQKDNPKGRFDRLKGRGGECGSSTRPQPPRLKPKIATAFRM